MKGQYRVTVYRRSGVTMQQFNADNLDQAMTVRHRNAGIKGVYRIDLSVTLESWTFETDPQQNN